MWPLSFFWFLSQTLLWAEALWDFPILEFYQKLHYYLLLSVIFQLLESLDFSTWEPGLHEETKTKLYPLRRAVKKILTKATLKPDGKGKLDLMFNFQDIFTLLILAYDFWISECCWVCYLEEKGEEKEAIYSSLSLWLQ